MRKLVFYFFFHKNWKIRPFYNIHFNCLNYYKDCFDEAYFALSFEDASDTNSILEIKEKLLHIFCNVKKIEFEIVESSPYCECLTFKKEIVDKLGEDDLVFFAHSKATTLDITDFSLQWAASLYYCSLNGEKENNEISYLFISKNNEMLSYGSLPLIYDFDKPYTMNKYKWIYAGTFFWIHSKRLKEYIEKNDITLPLICDRFYAESFLGNIFPNEIEIPNDSEKIILSGSLNKHSKLIKHPNVNNINDLINETISGEKEQFNHFVEKISER